MVELAERVRSLQRQGTLELPFPGSGDTPQRHKALAEFGCMDLSVARIVEAHTDALAILAEDGRPGQPDSLYGVWASDGPQSCVTAHRTDTGWRLAGTKQYCSGATLVDTALVTAHADDGLLLFEVPLHLNGVTVLPSTWASPAMADTVTVPVDFGDVALPRDAQVGGPGWYLERHGFWHGAFGPAACWAGGAISLIDAAIRLGRRDPHSRAHVGALKAIRWGLNSILEQAGREIDATAADSALGRQRALMGRQLIERWCTEVMDRFGRATGPALLAMDDGVSRQYTALTIYIRQCHAERDLEGLADKDSPPTPG